MTNEMQEQENILNKGITNISVAGYKSIADEQSIDIRPLTILAGANSSGKSSIMQPLLLMKQTLEASFDPGPLAIMGDQLNFTSADQFLSANNNSQEKQVLKVSITTSCNFKVINIFKKGNQGIELVESVYEIKGGKFSLHENVTQTDLDAMKRYFPESFLESIMSLMPAKKRNNKSIRKRVGRKRCFYNVYANYNNTNNKDDFVDNELTVNVELNIKNMIHIPGLRGNPERLYPKSAVGDQFPGDFIQYTASIIYSWQENNSKRFKILANYLERLGLTKIFKVRLVNDAQVELKVSRYPAVKGGKNLVSIADVGIGVSQILPVLVALLVAEPEQLVYIEQPELHLHPRAQMALGEILAAEAKRGIKIVVETHSPLLILTIQSLVAEDKIDKEYVKLHWFQRNKKGVTEIKTAELDENGAYGDWPEDFGDVALQAESRYLNAPMK